MWVCVWGGGTVKLWLSHSLYLHSINHLTTKSVSDIDDYKILPTGSEERGVLGIWSVPVAILPSFHYNIAL